jgi:Fuc2NAc and GlcNAc transferase
MAIMAHWTFYIIIFITSLVATYMIRRWLIRRSILDVPNERSSHLIPTPRGGGIAVTAVWFGGLVVLKYLNIISPQLFYALIGGVLLAVVGLVDDVVGIKPVIRLISQFVCISLAVYFLSDIGRLDFFLVEITQNWILYPVFILGGIWFINLYNFLDGIDAYAATETIMVAAGMYIVTGSEILLLLIFSVAGFLIWNWPKAKIFMGDIGSTQLGYILVVLGLYFHNTHELDIIYWLILTSLFWMDASMTLVRRLLNREKLSKAHKNHGYQRIVQYGYSHQKVVIISLLINAFFIFLMYGSLRFNLPPVYLLIFVMLFNYLLQKTIDRLKAYPYH